MEDNTKDQKDYEMGFVAKDETGAPAILALLKQHGAEILLEGPIEKITLAYPIDRHTSGYFGYIHFRTAPQVAVLIGKAASIHTGLLRHLLITPPFEKQRPRWEGRPRRGTAVTTAPAPSESHTASPLPLSNEALEKKIEEILK